MPDLPNLEKELDIQFNDKDLLRQAFTHRSYLNENTQDDLRHNERLEFLGDAVLEIIVTEYLFKNYSEPEGKMTSWRAALVNTQSLAETANQLGFSNYLLLSKGEAKDVGKARNYILANTFEAFIGALYIDSGLEICRKFIETSLISKLPKILEQGSYIDDKSCFQEKSQEKVKITPTYRVLKDWGPDHAKSFVVGVFLDEELVAKGEGSSKQEAEEAAARAGLKTKKWS